jgi:hypothetical protein
MKTPILTQRREGAKEFRKIFATLRETFRWSDCLKARVFPIPE